MSVTSISRLARDQIYNRLADPDFGLNQLIDQVNLTYSLTPPIRHVDFSPSSKNFYFAQTTPYILESTAEFRYPLIFLYNHGIVNRNWEKFRKFSGNIVMGLDVWLSWTKSAPRHDFETYGDAIEEIILEIVNGFGVAGDGSITQNWGVNLVYNGGVSVSRTDLALAGDNWMQGYQFRFTFHGDAI